MAVDPIPKGQPVVSPFLHVEGARKLLDFLQATFGGKVTELLGPDGRVAHAEVRIGDSVVKVGESSAARPSAPASLYIYVRDVDATYRTALSRGGTSVMEPADQFYGDRRGGVKDPCGNTWWIAMRIEDVGIDELQRRIAALPA